MTNTTFRALSLSTVLVLALLWGACSTHRAGEREPVIGVTPLSELANDEPPPYRPADAGRQPAAEQDAGEDGAGDGGEEDLTYEEAFEDDVDGGDSGDESDEPEKRADDSVQGGSEGEP